MKLNLEESLSALKAEYEAVLKKLAELGEAAGDTRAALHVEGARHFLQGLLREPEGPTAEVSADASLGTTQATYSQGGGYAVLSSSLDNFSILALGSPSLNNAAVPALTLTDGTAVLVGTTAPPPSVSLFSVGTHADFHVDQKGNVFAPTLDGGSIGAGLAASVPVPPGAVLAAGDAAQLTVSAAGALVAPSITTRGISVGALDMPAQPRATQLFNQVSGKPFPSPASFRTFGGTIVIFASGSGSWDGSGSGPIGMTVSLTNEDGGAVGKPVAVQVTATAKHSTFVSNPIVVTDLDAGTYTLSLAGLKNTTFDDDDVISVTVLELPDDASAVQVFANQSGVPDPSSYQGSGANLLVFASGSGQAQQSSTSIGMSVGISGYTCTSGMAMTYAPASSPTRQVFVPTAFVATRQPDTSATPEVTLSALSNTTTDDGDFYNMTILGLPADGSMSATEVLRYSVPTTLPVGPEPFVSYGGTLVIFASGSGMSKSKTTGMVGMNIQIDGVTRGVATVYSQGDQPTAFVANALVVTDIPPGSHTLALEPNGDTSADTNAHYFFQATVLEIPSGVISTPALTVSTSFSAGVDAQLRVDDFGNTSAPTLKVGSGAEFQVDASGNTSAPTLKVGSGAELRIDASGNLTAPTITATTLPLLYALDGSKLAMIQGTIQCDVTYNGTYIQGSATLQGSSDVSTYASNPLIWSSALSYAYAPISLATFFTGAVVILASPCVTGGIQVSVANDPDQNNQQCSWVQVHAQVVKSSAGYSGTITIPFLAIGKPL